MTTPGIDGVFNFRDVADADPTLASGLVFRADGLHRTSPSGGRRIAASGVRLVVDLRTDNERVAEGRFEHDGIGYLHVPIVENVADIVATIDPATEDVLRIHYGRMTVDNGHAFAAALERVADALDDGRPVVYHCTAGKDRTGVLTALLLAGVGLDTETVVADYARSGPAMTNMIRWYRTTSTTSPRERMAEMGLDPSLAERMIAAEPTTMRGFLADLVASEGSIGQYLASIDADRAVERIAVHLRPPAAGFSEQPDAVQAPLVQRPRRAG